MATTVNYAQDLGNGIRLLSITIPDAGSRLYTVKLSSGGKTFNELYNLDTKTMVQDVLGLTPTQLHVIFNAIEVITHTQ